MSSLTTKLSITNSSIRLGYAQGTLIDSHCHLNMLKDDLAEILQRAKDNGVGYMQTICTTMEELPDILNIAEKYDNIIVNYCRHPKIIGIG